MDDPHAAAAWPPPRPPDCNAALVLADGTVFWGRGIGAAGEAVGEVCFNTSMTGYQEILTDPSYAGQIITFTFPHVGNVGTNPEDIETASPAARGLIVRAGVTEPSAAASPSQVAERTNLFASFRRFIEAGSNRFAMGDSPFAVSKPPCGTLGV